MHEPLPPSQAARIMSRDRHVLNRRERAQRWWRSTSWEIKMLRHKLRNVRIEAPDTFRAWLKHPEVSRVLFRRIWVMAGPEVVLMGGKPSRQGEKVWLRQIHVPYYEGPGRSVRVNGWSIRVGVCRPKVRSPLMPWLFPERRGLYGLDTEVDFDAELGYALGRPLSQSAQEVRSWGSSSPGESGSETSSTSAPTPQSA